MNKAQPLYDNFMKAISTRDGCKIHVKQIMEVYLTETERMLSEFDKHTLEWWAYRLQEIREDLGEL